MICLIQITLDAAEKVLKELKNKQSQKGQRGTFFSAFSMRNSGKCYSKSTQYMKLLKLLK